MIESIEWKKSRVVRENRIPQVPIKNHLILKAQFGPVSKGKYDIHAKKILKNHF